MELQKLVESLIDRASEGSYWDFKQSWHSDNADLLKDIICMANNTTENMQRRIGHTRSQVIQYEDQKYPR